MNEFTGNWAWVDSHFTMLASILIGFILILAIMGKKSVIIKYIYFLIVTIITLIGLGVMVMSFFQ